MNSGELLRQKLIAIVPFRILQYIGRDGLKRSHHGIASPL